MSDFRSAPELPRRPFLGVRLDGATVVGLWPGAPVALRVGDRIEAIGTRDWCGDAALLLRGARPGDAVPVEVRRAGALQSIAVTLQPWPCESTSGAATHYGAVASQGARLRTIATIPDARPAVGAPVVLLIPGLTGPSVDHGPNVDDPLRRLVATLAAASIGTLRVERRGVGDSEGDPESAGFADEVDAYARALVALSQRAEIDASRSYAFGHSLGGIVAPLVAQRVPLAGIAAYGTTSRPWTEAWVASVERQVRLLGLTGVAAIQARRRADTAADSQHVFGRPRAYIEGLRGIDPAAAWAAYDGTVLLMHGEHDVVTTLDEHQGIQRHCPGATVRTLPGLDHAMLEVRDAATALRTPEGGRVVDDVAAAVAQFVTSTT